MPRTERRRTVRNRLATWRVIVINEAAAITLFGNEPPLGRRLTIFGADTEVVGVVRDTKYDSVRKETVPTMFLPYVQTSPPLTLGAMYVVARTNAAPAVSTGTLRSAVADVDRDVPVSRMKTQTDQIQESPRVHRPARSHLLRGRAPDQRDRVTHRARCAAH